MSEGKCSALPWTFAPAGRRMRESYSQSSAIASGDKVLVAGCFSDTGGGAEAAEANAALIVRCVNSHAALVGALKGVAALNENAGEIGAGMLVQLVTKARAALELAGE